MRHPLEYWKKLRPAWRFVLSAFVASRLALILWSSIVYAASPVALQNLDLFGEPVLAAFIPRTSERYVYSRQVHGEALSFQTFDAQHVMDGQTGSVWSLRNGNAVKGFYAGQSLSASTYSAERIFPYLGIRSTKHKFLSPWQRFDANWYLKIATRGYNGADGSTVYFPVYPMLIKPLAYVMDPMLAAMLVSNVALIGCLVLFYRLVIGLTDVAVAQRSLIYFLIFPTSFFLTAPYTESLFLFFTLGSFYCAAQRRWGLAAFWGALSALTRLQGVLLVLPLGYMLWREHRSMPLKEWMIRALPLACLPLATLAFLGFTNLSLLNTYQGTLHARFVFPWENISAGISILMGGQGSIVDALNLIVTLGLITMLYFVWKKLPLEYTLYSLLMVLAPMLRMTVTQPLVSMSRYALVVFPIFIVLGIWGRNGWANRMIVYTSVLLQLYLSAQFFLWGWVA